MQYGREGSKNIEVRDNYGLSRELAQRLWMPVVSRDEIKEGYVNTFGLPHDQLPSETNRVVSDFFFEAVNQYLTNKVSVIIEATFQHRV